MLPCSLALSGALALPAIGQPQAGEPPAVELSAEDDIAARRQALSADLAAARARLESAGVDDVGAKPPVLVREVERLERVDDLLTQWAAALRQEQELQQARAALASRLDAVRATGPDTPAPYTFLMLETARDELDTEEGRAPRIESGIEAARDALDQARRGYEERERARRLVQEASAGNDDPSMAAEVRGAKLESRVAETLVRFREREFAAEQLAKEIHELRLQEIQARIDWIGQRVRFQRRDLHDLQLTLATRERELRDQLERADRNSKFNESQLFDAKRRLDAATPDDPALVEEVEARRLALQLSRRQGISLGKRLEWLSQVNEAWDRRFALANAPDDPELITRWEREVEAHLAQIDIAIRLKSSDLAGVRNDLVTLDGKIAAQPPKDVARWLGEQRRSLAELEADFQAAVTALESTRRVQRRLLADIKRRRSQISVGERLARVWSSVRAVFRYEVASIDDRPITVGKIAIGVILLLVGLFISRFLSGVLGRRLLRRVGMPEGAAAAVQSLTFYLLLLLFALFALRLANVPLTAFTILGGALAIGAGFGSQAIIKNFFSGLILLAERPIRVGDLIQIGDLYGTVDHVGARSTRVRTGDNFEIIVPNSSFLEQNVINWTLSENKVRVSVTVGVVYGSPTRDITRLLTKAAVEHGRVIKTPAPVVLFNDFGDNALHFEILFWIMMRRIMDRRMIESDIRYRIDHLFREAGIVIAFPQRDVHLDAVNPVPVRVVHEAPEDDGREVTDDQV